MVGVYEAAEGCLQLVAQLSVFLDIRAYCRKAAASLKSWIVAVYG